MMLDSTTSREFFQYLVVLGLFDFGKAVRISMASASTPYSRAAKASIFGSILLFPLILEATSLDLRCQYLRQWWHLECL